MRIQMGKKIISDLQPSTSVYGWLAFHTILHTTASECNKKSHLETVWKLCLWQTPVRNAHHTPCKRKEDNPVIKNSMEFFSVIIFLELSVPCAFMHFILPIVVIFLYSICILLSILLQRPFTQHFWATLTVPKESPFMSNYKSLQFSGPIKQE